MHFGVPGPLANGPCEVTSAGFGIRAAEDVDEEPAARLLRHELPAAAGLRVVGKGGFERGRRVELGFAGGGEKLDGLLEAAEARGFFLDAADEVVKVNAESWGEGVEESFEAVAAEGAKKERVEGHGGKPYH